MEAESVTNLLQRFEHPSGLLTPPTRTHSEEDEHDHQETIMVDVERNDDDSEEKENPSPLAIDIDKVKTLSPVSMVGLSPAMLQSPNLTVASAVASEKVKQRQINNAIEKVVAKTGNNLYPTRDEKERIAQEIGVTYIQVNRWFANRRRKQTKHRKVLGGSPVDMVSAAAQRQMPTPPALENDRLMQQLEEKAEGSMVAQMPEHDVNVQTMDRPMADATTIALLGSLMAQGSPINPAIVAALASSAPQQQQLSAALLQHYIQQQMMAQFQQQQQQLYGSHVTSSPNHSIAADQWMSPPISESPHESDMCDAENLHASTSPAFKDPHGIADPAMKKLLDEQHELSEKESIAISVLTNMATMHRRERK